MIKIIHFYIDIYIRRGFVPGDEKEFSKESMIKLKEAQKDIFMLINRGYPIKSASTFVGNHYLLSERQRIALVRATSTKENLDLRSSKEIRPIKNEEKNLAKKEVYIDGFNIIITLEVALSNSTLIRCMDGNIRDLAGLRGTYKLIDKTDRAIDLIGQELEKLKVSKAVFYLDKPVSNSGRLKMKIIELLDKYDFAVEVELVDNADKMLEGLDNVISSDAIVIDKCSSWINLNRSIIDNNIEKLNIKELC